MKGPSQAARELLADKVASSGPAWANTASAIRGGFSNVWIAFALDAIDYALDIDRDAASEGPEA